MEKRYFQFPIMLLKKAHTNYDEAMEEIISFAIVDYALKQDITAEDAARQALYDHYQKNGLRELISLMDQYVWDGKIIVDQEHNGFDPRSGKFESYEGIESVKKPFESDNALHDLAVKNCQLSKIDEFFGITGPALETRLENYNKIKKRIDQHEQRFGKEPMPTIEKKLFFDFREKPAPILFSAYIAIRSLQGQKNFVATTRNVILMRMLGAKSNKALEEHLKDKNLEEVYHRFTRSDKALRYNFDKLFDRLLSRGLLRSKIFERSVSRKIFLSTTIDYDGLAEKIVEQSNKRNHKAKEHEAVKKIRNATK